MVNSFPGKIITLERLVVPEKCIIQVLESCHDSCEAGHLGTSRTLERISRQFWWHGWTQDAILYVKSCELCMRRNNKNRHHGLLQPQILNMPEEEIYPMSSLVIDQIEMPSLKSFDYSRILIAMDVTTRYLFLRPVKSLNTQEVRFFIDEIQKVWKDQENCHRRSFIFLE